MGPAPGAGLLFWRSKTVCGSNQHRHAGADSKGRGVGREIGRQPQQVLPQPKHVFKKRQD
jgi:hypothetical protein